MSSRRNTKMPRSVRYAPSSQPPETTTEAMEEIQHQAGEEEDTDCRECGVNGGAHRPTCSQHPESYGRHAAKP